MFKRPMTYLISAIFSLSLVMPSTAAAAVSSTPAAAAGLGLQYLANSQQANGSISGSGLGESEWSAVAVEAGGQNIASFTNGGSSLLAFLQADAPTATTPAGTLERKIIAIASAGQDPASFGGVDYEALLATQHVGGQIGDPTLLNDDIFGIIAIDAAHDTALQPEAQDALDYLLAHQSADGGFSYTTASCAWCGSDSSDTASAIVAMYAASDLGLGSPSVDAARSTALAYLLGTQQSDGGFGSDASSPSDGSSTSWALMALNTIGSPVSASAASARGWLLGNQNPDGGFSYGAFGITNSDTYTTSGAVTALLGTTWLMRPDPSAVTTVGGGGSTAPTPTPAPHISKSTASATSTPGTTQLPAAVSTAQADATPGPPQVKGASITKGGNASSVGSSAKKSDIKKQDARKARPYNIYFVFLLGIIAVMWFAVEPRKARRGNI